MLVFRWIVAILAILVIVTFGVLAHLSATAADGGILAPEAFRNVLWAGITFFVANLLLNARK